MLVKSLLIQCLLIMPRLTRFIIFRKTWHLTNPTSKWFFDHSFQHLPSSIRRWEEIRSHYASSPSLLATNSRLCFSYTSQRWLPPQQVVHSVQVICIAGSCHHEWYRSVTGSISSSCSVVMPINNCTLFFKVTFPHASLVWGRVRPSLSRKYLVPW